MTEWWTYRPSDFLLFSPQTYYHLFELYNTDIWPMQLLALVLGVAILVLIYLNPPWQGRVIAAILAACWLWVAWAYHLQRYATINWAAIYYAEGFAIEAALLIWIGVIRAQLVFIPATRALYRVGISIFLFALIAQPIVAPLAGRTWTQAEIFGIAPDPTVIATLGLLLLTADKNFWLLFIIPLLWCIISGTILWTMKSPNAFIILLAGLLAIIFLIYKMRC
jgi:hypothetical protein